MREPPYTDGGFDCGGTNERGRVSYDIDEDEAPSEVVVRAVAAVTNTAPLDLRPLYDVVDPDYVDRALRATDGAADAELSFTYEGCEVTVTDGRVHVVTVADEE